MERESTETRRWNPKELLVRTIHQRRGRAAAAAAAVALFCRPAMYEISSIQLRLKARERLMHTNPPGSLAMLKGDGGAEEKK